MALSGVFYGTTNNQYVRPKIEWSAVQSQEGNYSDVTATLYYSRTNTYEPGTEGEWSGTLTIDADTKRGWVEQVKITYESNTRVLSHTVRVYHDSYGEKTLTIAAQGRIYPSSVTETQISAQISLDTILHSSQAVATAANIGQATTVTVRRRSENCLHSIAYRFGELEGFIGQDWTATKQEELLKDTVISFVIPEEFYTQIPNASAGICTLTCRTYLDGRLLGQPQETAFTVAADPQVCAPELWAQAQDARQQTLALTGDALKMIPGFSDVLCRADARAKNGATLTQLRVNGQAMENGQLTFSQAEQGEYLFVARDSRGFESTCLCHLQMLPYRLVTCNISVRRLSPTGDTGYLKISGNYFAGSFGAKNNSLLLCYRINGGDYIPLQPTLSQGTYQVEREISGLDYTRVNTVEVVAKDALWQAVGNAAVQKGIPVFDWGQEDFTFHVPVHFDGGIAGLGQLVYPVGAVYLSVSETRPEILFGGQWERLKDVFLLASGDRFAPGSTGGEESHTLTLEEIPSHNHQIPAFVQTAAGSGAFDYFRNNASDHTVTGEAAGGGLAHNNMPPYLAVYAWRRLA